MSLSPKLMATGCSLLPPSHPAPPQFLSQSYKLGSNFSDLQVEVSPPRKKTGFYTWSPCIFKSGRGRRTEFLLATPKAVWSCSRVMPESFTRPWGWQVGNGTEEPERTWGIMYLHSEGTRQVKPFQPLWGRDPVNLILLPLRDKFVLPRWSKLRMTGSYS